MIQISLPAWIPEIAEVGKHYASREDRMRLCIELARQNILRDRGGPFGAAVFECESGRLVGAGVNRVVPLNNSVLHAEMMAYMHAEQQLGSYTLAAQGLPDHEVVSSCEPCAMCLGGAQWAGVKRIVFGATRDDASELDFDEGPVFPESYVYLQARGIETIRGFMRDEAREIFRLYREVGGPVY